jgi:hypothetical protein
MALISLSDSRFSDIFRSNSFCSSRLLSRESAIFKPVVAFVVLGSVCGVPPRRVSRYAGTDIRMVFGGGLAKVASPPVRSVTGKGIEKRGKAKEFNYRN